MSLLGEHSSGQSAQVSSTTHAIPESAGVGWGIEPFETGTTQQEQPPPEQPQSPTQSPPQQQTQQQIQVPQQDAEIVLTPELQQKYSDFDDFLRATTGRGLSDVVEVLTSFDTFRQEYGQERELKALQKEWGSAYEERFAKVIEIYKALPPEEQAHYDNRQGAIDLWNRYELEQFKLNQRNVNVRNAVPRSTNTVPPSEVRAYDYTASEIENLARTNPKEYDRQKDRITQAYLTGRVRR